MSDVSKNIIDDIDDSGRAESRRVLDDMLSKCWDGVADMAHSIERRQLAMQMMNGPERVSDLAVRAPIASGYCWSECIGSMWRAQKLTLWQRIMRFFAGQWRAVKRILVGRI